jgi:hypothetical protein
LNTDGPRPFETSSDVLSRRVDNELVLVKISSNEIFALNSTAARIWELLEEGADINAAVAALSQEYGQPEPEETIRAQVEAFVRQALDLGFLVR